MLVDIEGRVRNIQLSPNRALHPLFEAVANSIHSIQDAKIGDGRIDVLLERSGEGPRSLLDGSDLRPLNNVIIKDNGVGFTKDNFDSFNKSDSRYKLAAKGIGRFTWLIAFDGVQVESIFREESKWYKRTFDFVMRDQGIEKEEKVEIPPPADGQETTVRLLGFKDKYRAKSEKGLETIADKIIEYFLFYFTQKNSPTISLTDHQDILNLNAIYQENVRGKNQPPKTFEIKGQKFEILNLQLYLSRERNHKIHFCANSRAVKNIDATSYIPDLAAKRVTDHNGQLFKYSAYVSGPYLDEHVSPDRTNFNIPLSSNDLDAGEEVSFEEILDASSSLAKDFLEPCLRPIRENRIADQKKFIRKNPQFRIIETRRPEALSSLKPDLSEAELDAQLNKILFDIETDIRTQTREIINNVSDSADYRERYKILVEAVTEVSQSKLAQHVIHRKVILDLLREHLKIKKDGTYQRESVIHQTIFPRWKTSDEVIYDDQNLWILDERLSYHRFLASDKALSTYTVLKTKDARKPDITIFGESESPYDSVVIIEFKRPMREGYTDEDPIRKLFEIAESIRNSDSDAVDDEGRPIKTHSASRIYCYLICDLVADQIQKHAKMNRLTQTPDGEAYYGYHPEFEAAMEVIDYNRLVTDAVKRNQILFDRLDVNS
jgi:hypothetical protein